MVDIDISALNGKGLSPSDVVNAISAENLILPAGTEKIGSTEYAVELNGSPLPCRNSTTSRSSRSTAT